MSRKLLMNTDDPYNIDVMKLLTRGMNIGNDYQIYENPRYWATVDAVTVVSGQKYRLTADATWASLVFYDDNDEYVYAMSGDDNNPQDFIFIADSNHVRFTIYDPEEQLTYYTVKAVK